MTISIVRQQHVYNKMQRMKRNLFYSIKHIIVKCLVKVRFMLIGWEYYESRNIQGMIRKDLLSFEESDVENWAIKVNKLEHEHLECKWVFIFCLSSMSFCNRIIQQLVNYRLRQHLMQLLSVCLLNVYNHDKNCGIYTSVHALYFIIIITWTFVGVSFTCRQ